MKAHLLVALAAALVISTHVKADDWDWRFEPEKTVVSSKAIIDVVVEITNYPEAKQDIQVTGFDFLDGTFGQMGIFYDDKKRYLYTATSLDYLISSENRVLKPGERRRFKMATLTPSENVKEGTTYLLMPNFHVRIGCGNSDKVCESVSRSGPSLTIVTDGQRPDHAL